MGFYQSEQWQHARLAVLLRDGWQCQCCGVILGSGRKSPQAAVVDHLQPLETRPDLALDPDNLRAVCKQCHDGPYQRIEQLYDDPRAIRRAKLAHQARRFDERGFPVW